MDDATQKLVDGARKRALELYGRADEMNFEHPQDTDDWEDADLLDALADALEAAQRPPGGEAFAEAFERFSMGLDYSNRDEAEAGFRAGWEAAQRPPVSASGLTDVLMEVTTWPRPSAHRLASDILARLSVHERPPVSPEQREVLLATVRAASAEYFREDLPEDGRDESDTIVDALLAGFSLPVLDVEKVARFLYSLDPAIQGWNGDPYGYSEPNAKGHRDRAQQWAERLIEALPTLTANPDEKEGNRDRA